MKLNWIAPASIWVVSNKLPTIKIPKPSSTQCHWFFFIIFTQGCKPSDIRWAKQKLPELEKLTISIHPLAVRRNFSRTIQFKKVKQLKVRIFDENDDLDDFPLQFNQLEELDFNCYWSILRRIEFARKNDLKKLTLYTGLEPSYSLSELTTIVNQWPNLEEISLQLEHPDEVCFLMNNLKHLKKVVINNIATDEYQTNFVNELPSKIAECKDWKITKNEVINC